MFIGDTHRELWSSMRPSQRGGGCSSIAAAENHEEKQGTTEVRIVEACSSSKEASVQDSPSSFKAHFCSKAYSKGHMFFWYMKCRW